MESAAVEEPHEPFGQQISMEEAIDLGIEWLKNFYLNFVIEEYGELGTYDKVTATLCKKEFNTDHSTISEELYSYWTVEYIVKGLKVKLVLNSVTGQVLRAKLSHISDGIQEHNLLAINSEELLVAYAKSFSMNTNLVMKQVGSSMILREEGSEFEAILQKDTIIFSEKGKALKISGNNFELYLRTE